MNAHEEVTVVPTNTRFQSVDRVKSHGDTIPYDDDQGLFRYALITLAVGNTVAIVYLLRTAVYVLYGHH